MFKNLIRKIIYSPFYLFTNDISFGKFITTARQIFIVKSKEKGKLFIGVNTTIGNPSSPGFLSYSYLNIRNNSRGITIGNSSKIGNRITIISNKRIVIGDRCLIGNDVKFYDSDFHSIQKDRRMFNCMSETIMIGNNVFIADNVIVLKGVCIGDNSVIGAGSVVTRSYGKNSIIAGNPARKINNVL